MIPQPEHKVESAGPKIGFMKPEKYKKLLLLLLAGMFSLHIAVAWRSRDLVRKGYPDFTALYSAGKIVREGLGKQLYDTQTQFRIQQEFAAGVSIRQGPLPYIHPPWEALVLVPFTWFSYPVALLLWDAVNVLILLSLPFLLRNLLPRLKQISFLFWPFVSLAFYPIFFDLLQGQDILPLLLFFTLAFVSLKQNNDLTAGCWLGLGLFRFHLVLPVVFILLLHKRLKALLGCISCLRSGAGFDCDSGLERGVELSRIRVAHRDRDGTRSDRSDRHAESARSVPHFSRRPRFETGYSTHCGSLVGCFVVLRIREVAICERGNSLRSGILFGGGQHDSGELSRQYLRPGSVVFAGHAADESSRGCRLETEMESDNTRGTNVAVVRESAPDASSAKIWEVEFAFAGIAVVGLGIGQRNLKDWKFPQDPHHSSCLTSLRTLGSQACLFLQLLGKAPLPA